MFQNNQSQGGYANNNNYQQRPPPINTQQQQSNLRQGKFLSPSNNTNAAAMMNNNSTPANYTYQHSPNAAQSTVHFEEEEESSHGGSRLDIPSFMFEECEFSTTSNDGSKSFDNSDADKAGGSKLPHHHNFQTSHGRNKESEDDEAIIPSEAQLTLLCLDYLRDLRRSYALHPDGTSNVCVYVFVCFI